MRYARTDESEAKVSVFHDGPFFVSGSVEWTEGCLPPSSPLFHQSTAYIQFNI
jgi:hypothetical protein